jgi:hypothetical protein
LLQRIRSVHGRYCCKSLFARVIKNSRGRTTLFSGDQARAEKLLEAAFLPKVGIPTAVNEWLINTGEKLILVDTGASNVFAPTLGRLPQNLAAAGVDPSAVDAVVITANDNWCRFCRSIHYFGRCAGVHCAIGRARGRLPKTRSPDREHRQSDLKRDVSGSSSSANLLTSSVWSSERSSPMNCKIVRSLCWPPTTP